MPIEGYRVRDPNYILRFCFMAFVGIIAFGSVMSWRSSLLFASEYQDMPVTHEQLKIKNQNLAKQKIMKNLLNNEVEQ